MRNVIRVAGVAALLAASIGACSAPAASPPPSVPPSTTASPSPQPSPSPAPSPSPSPAASPSPPPTAPSSDTFWEAARSGIVDAGSLEVVATGPSPGVLRYTADASATVTDGEVTFVCVDGKAYEGASGGFAELPGTWTCGAGALVAGFRRNGQPLDAWNESVPADSSRETLGLSPQGDWTWQLDASSATYGGSVRATVVLDPVTGQILEASRIDPLGATTYAVTYRASFPPIVAP